MVGSDLERILWNLRAAIADRTYVYNSNFTAQFPPARRVEDVWQDNLDILLEQPVDDHVSDKPHNNGISEEESKPKKSK